MKRNCFYIIVFLTLIASCSESEKNKIKTVAHSELIIEKKDSVKKEVASFDVNKFMTLTDSLLTSITGKQIKLNCIIDTLTKERVKIEAPYYLMTLSDHSIIKRYSFSPGKGNAALKIWFIEAVYNDSLFANKAYKALSKDALEDASGENNSPGLTYTNDFVIKTANSICWLNTGCPYAEFNMKKIKSFFLNSLTTANITDSINCRCGAPRCEVFGIVH